jgi:hypothetical protein
MREKLVSAQQVFVTQWSAQRFDCNTERDQPVMTGKIAADYAFHLFSLTQVDKAIPGECIRYIGFLLSSSLPFVAC